MDKAEQFLCRKKNASLLSVAILTGQQTGRHGRCNSGHTLQTSEEDLLTPFNNCHFVKWQHVHLMKLTR